MKIGAMTEKEKGTKDKEKKKTTFEANFLKDVLFQVKIKLYSMGWGIEVELF